MSELIEAFRSATDEEFWRRRASWKTASSVLGPLRDVSADEWERYANRLAESKVTPPSQQEYDTWLKSTTRWATLHLSRLPLTAHVPGDRVDSLGPVATWAPAYAAFEMALLSGYGETATLNPTDFETLQWLIRTAVQFSQSEPNSSLWKPPGMAVLRLVDTLGNRLIVVNQAAQETLTAVSPNYFGAFGDISAELGEQLQGPLGVLVGGMFSAPLHERRPGWLPRR